MSKKDMDKTQAHKKIHTISQKLDEHNYRYYVLNQPTISDQEYDVLLRELIDLEKKFPQWREPNSPTQRVGVKLPSGAKAITHQVKMFSLDNTYSIEELQEWHQRISKGIRTSSMEFVVELKIDGVSAALTYKKGQLVEGATRGDGATGEDVTHSLKTIRSIPLQLKRDTRGSLPELLIVHGEIYMNHKDFESLNRERKRQGEVLFANPRNATSGSVKLLDSRITAQRPLNCFIHSFGMLKHTQSLKTQWQFLNQAKEWGFCVNTNSRSCQNIDEVIRYCQEYQGRRQEFSYDVDGVVVKVNALDSQVKLGSTLKSPRWAVAYKFPAHQATTTIEDIRIQVGRTGVLTPVAQLKPVECAGVTISRSTLHNFDEVKRLGVKKGDRVLIQRAGDVIPKIVKVLEHSKGQAQRILAAPTKCPECSGPIVKERTEEVAYRCNNPSCPKQLERRLLHFASRGAMDIEGLGESIVVQLLEKELVKDLADIYYLKKSDLLELELFADKRAENLLKSIQDNKKQPLSRFLFGLGIANVGEKASLILAKRFRSMDQLMSTKIKDFERIHEIGPVIAASLSKFFAYSSTKKVIKKFVQAGVNLKEPTTKLQFSRLAGKKFIFTGELSSMTRTEAAQHIQDLGGEVVSSVSKNTDFVVTGKKPGSKYNKAKQLKIALLTEKKFEEMIHGS